MKQFIFFILLLPYLASAQSPVSDTTYVVQIADMFYLITKTDYSDGGYSEQMRRIGDASQFFQSALQRFESDAMNMANLVTGYVSNGRQIGTAIRENAGITSATAKSPLDTLAQRARPHLIDAGATWTLVTPTGNTSVTFSATANGALRYALDGATPRSVTAFAKYIIRLAAYPAAGQFLDLYWDEGRNRYVSQDGKFILRRNVTR
jgi:hypothetical protein